ncbi:TonB-dependent receptor [Pelomonas sp. SE-A7]|uniref:TonB-dependent receptor n=1 Tax=Pelomonas sp. SE-A7 TaxID=3054953 RepID=UPI00259CF6E1|nr:TonB-dependent receptor [Pelomonas sp. SE-A7]MDM4767664.1 TonB-dependent receptor plug domain-containing protein [Pelomonas sp. SE-A7]
MQSKKNLPAHLSVTAGAVALALGLMAAAPVAVAQSNTTTTIYGEVKLAAGATVVLQNLDTGVQRTLTPDAAGRFQANSMPPGRYQLRLMRNGKVEATQEVEALVGNGVEANFGVTNTLDTVTVSGAAKRIDVSNTNNGVVFTAKELKALPVAADVAAVIQLTPGVVRGTNGQYGNAPSIAGSGQSENSFYVNGFPITNILTQVGASELPFGAIGNMQVLSGGYGAEFGRSTGGVVNITTKSGGNKFEVGGKLSWIPGSLKGKQYDTYYPNTGEHPPTDGKLQYWNQGNESSSKVVGLYAGGPVIPNKLFAFVALEQTRSESESIAMPTSLGVSSPTGWSKSDSKVDRYLAKLDYNLTDDHHFELTKLYDKTTSRSQAFGFNYSTLTHDNTPGNGRQTYVNCCGSGSAPGADISIFKYTGYLSDDLTVTAVYGDSRTKHSRTPEGYNASLAQTSSAVSARVPGLSYAQPQTVTGSLVDPESGDRQKGLRLDIEYKLGQHSLRGGIDRLNVNSVVGNSLAGGYRWTYRKATDPNRAITGAFETPFQGGGYGTQGYYVSKDIDTNLARPSGVQAAQYIQDHWQLSDRVLLDLGLRREQFTNYTSNGDAFISQRNMIAPRLGATWDFAGDGSLKLFANAGRYHLPVPSNLSSNMAAPLTRTGELFTYTGVDANGAPTGLHAISKPYSANNAYGQSRNALEVTAIDLKPLSQDEFSLGLEKALNKSLVVGASFLYRRLNDTNDDTCDQRPIDAWAEKNHVDASHWGGFQCAIMNPGRDNNLWIDFLDGKGLRRVDISAAEWGTPKPARKYAALNLFAEHPFRDGWYGKLTYTLSTLKGNMEGQTDTLGGGDVALTVSDDHKELMYNAYGYLPSDHRHAIKAYGFVQITPEVTVGANVSLISGGPRNCLGELPDALHDGTAGSYGGAYFYCNGKPSPRGSLGRLPWTAQLDMNLAYMPAAVKGLSLKADVFNLLNRRSVTRYNENREDGGAVTETYLQVAGRTGPRSVRLTAEYNYAF